MPKKAAVRHILGSSRDASVPLLDAICTPVGTYLGEQFYQQQPFDGGKRTHNVLGQGRHLLLETLTEHLSLLRKAHMETAPSQVATLTSTQDWCRR